MLTYMRKRSKSWITKFIFGAIIIVFIFWGGSAYWSGEANKVAKIDRYIITQQQFAKAYSDALRLYQARLGDAFTPEVLAQLDLKKTVLDQMINDYIVNDEARKLGVSVSDEELQEAIRTFPAFQQNGQFSIDSYKRLLQYQRMTPAEFEEQQRKALFQQRVYSMITENIIVSPQEVEAYYQYQNDSFNLNYLAVDAKSFSKDAVVGDEEAAAYYEANKERYKIAPRIVLTAVLFPVEQYFDEAAVSVDEARDYYDSHRQEFAEEAKIHGRHILIRVPQDADQTTIDKKRAAAQKIYDQVKAGGNFAELAKKYSEDPGTSAAGGDIGTVPQSSLPASIAEAFSGMKRGEVRGPVQTALGFHVLKLENKSEAKQRSFEEVSASIVERMRYQRAMAIARDEAGNAHMELFEQGITDLADYAESRGLETREIGPFAEGENIGVAGSEEVARQAFMLPQGEIGAVVETDEGCMIYMVREKIAARIPELQEIRSRVVEDVLTEKSLEKAKEHAGDLAKKTLAELNAMSPESTGEFRRTSYLVPKLGMIEGLQDDLGSLQDPKVYTHRNTVYVVWLKEKKEALASGAGENELKRIREELLLRKKEMAIKAFIEEARKRHDVVIDYAKIT